VLEKTCKGCGVTFMQFRSTQNLCSDCQYQKVKESSTKQVRKRIIQRGRVTHEWLDIDRPKWFKNHPPSHQGYYKCYLQISPSCIRYMTKSQTTLDHVKARSSSPGKRRRQQNFKPACSYCNRLKGSKTLARIKKEYPNSLIARGSMSS
jgi:5-methylcytosine-specific restriction endonuclease McrA